MKLKLEQLFLIILWIFSVCSCSKDLNSFFEIVPPQEDTYTIRIEDALSSLENFMIENGMPMTKGGMNNYIDNFFPISISATKSSTTTGNVLYAVNFKEEGGYALLAADSRIKEDILAVTDKGSISEGDFFEPIIVREPTDNDDLSESEYYSMVETGVLAAGANQINRECLRYAANAIGEDEFDDNGNTETYSWKTINEVPRMLSTAWTQSTLSHDIFDKYCPEVGLIIKRKAPAGCVCIAISQIIAYHEFPQNLFFEGTQMDYPQMKQIYYYDGESLCNRGTTTSKEMLAKFCINIGAWCKTKYHSIFGKSWGFAWPSNAKSCLETFGYKNVSWNLKYDESQVLESLDNGCPVFMSAIAGFCSGHAWVVDGYLKRNYVSSKGKVIKSQTLVHCNWGWSGDCNGYFTSGVFHTQEAKIQDDGLGNSTDQNYWCAFNTITYDNPK